MRINIQSHWSAINRFATLGDQRIAIYPAEWAMNIHIRARIHPGCESRTLDHRSSRTEVEGRNEGRWWIRATYVYSRGSSITSYERLGWAPREPRTRTDHFLQASSEVVHFSFFWSENYSSASILLIQDSWSWRSLMENCLQLWVVWCR